MTDLKRLEAIFKHIRENGTLRPRMAGSMGGIWSSDIYDMGENMAQLCDDGSTQMVSQGFFRAWSTYGRPVEYSRGSDAAGLEAMFNSIFQEEKAS